MWEREYSSFYFISCELANQTGRQCWEFLQAIKQATGLRIHLETRPFLAKGNREATSGCHKCPCHRCRQKFEIQPAPDRQINSKERDKAGEDDGPEAESRSSDEDAADFQPTMSEPPKVSSNATSTLTVSTALTSS